jgi:hypothetical protein
MNGNVAKALTSSTNIFLCKTTTHHGVVAQVNGSCWFPSYLHEFSNVCYSNEIPYISIIVKICNDWAMGKQHK